MSTPLTRCSGVVSTANKQVGASGVKTQPVIFFSCINNQKHNQEGVPRKQDVVYTISGTQQTSQSYTQKNALTQSVSNSW